MGGTILEDRGLTFELPPPDVLGDFVIVPLLPLEEGVLLLYVEEVSAELLRLVIVPTPCFVKGGMLFFSAAVGVR